MIEPSGTCRALIVAGEASGDLHGANLIQAAREFAPGLSFFGVGGERMAAAGCDILTPSDDIAVMGLIEVLGRLPVIRRVFRRLERALTGAEKPDLVILIDYPGFNLRFAKVARKAGIPILYYISPKVWAWGGKRVRLLAERVDCLAVIFPFEPEIFAQTDLDVRYVGNPLLDEFQPGRSRADYLGSQGLDPGQPVVGLFPGSRQKEIQYLFDTILETAKLLSGEGAARQFLMPLAASLDRAELQRRLDAEALNIRLVTDNIYEVAAACDAVLCVSGTVTLQVALAGTPMVVIYRAAPLTYAVGRRLVKIPFFSLVNIVAGEEVVREFLQDDANPPVLAQELKRLLEDSSSRESMRSQLAIVKNKLGGPGCSERVARIARELCLRKT
jgi:lipid-A-disaccharide synthase